MSNKLRRFTQEEYELLMSALRAQSLSYKDLPVQMEKLKESSTSALMKLLTGGDFNTYAEKQCAKSEALRERLMDLFNHDCDWLGEGPTGEEPPRYCLGCRRRHTPHCDKCPGCMPDLPE